MGAASAKMSGKWNWRRRREARMGIDPISAGAQKTEPDPPRAGE
jgi:hypothetical protein